MLDISELAELLTPEVRQQAAMFMLGALVVGMAAWTLMKVGSYLGRKALLVRKKLTSLRRELPMTERERREDQATTITDALFDVIENSVYKGKMTYQEAHTWYDRIARSTGIYTLMRARYRGDVNLMDQYILKRKLKMFQMCKHRNRKAIPFPDSGQPKPVTGEAVALPPSTALDTLMPGWK